MFERRDRSAYAEQRGRVSMLDCFGFDTLDTEEVTSRMVVARTAHNASRWPSAVGGGTADILGAAAVIALLSGGRA